MDEIYEFGACENCVESGDEEEVAKMAVQGLINKRYSDNGKELVLSELCEDTTKKLEIHLKAKRSNQTETDLNDGKLVLCKFFDVL